jgi:hypothetical protein
MKVSKAFVIIVFVSFCAQAFMPAGVAAQDVEQQSTAANPTDEIELMLANITPEGWQLTDEAVKYIPENLYELINGRAEYYLSYNMISMIYASYNRASDNSRFIDVSIFDMGKTIGAFGVFAGERLSGGPPINLGRDAFRSGSDIYIWKGQYYIQINSSETRDDLWNIELEMAEKITDYLNDKGDKIWGLQVLPAENQVPNSVQFLLVDAFGYSFLRNTFTAKYLIDETEVSVFISSPDSPEAQTLTITKFKEHVLKYGKGVDSISSGGAELIVCDMGRYFDIIFQKGSYVAGITGQNDKELAIRAATLLKDQILVE